MKKRISFLLVSFVIALTTFAQQGFTITGNVVEASTSEPMPGVTVKVEGKTTATATDINGNYSINVERGDILSFSFLGMQTFLVTVTSSDPINVRLKDDNVLLDQVVVIGYGTVKKSDLTGAVSSIGSKDLMTDVARDASSALQGKIPGVSVANNNGLPGAGMKITVRGITSLQSNDPLYVIDGVYGDINLIDPSDIASIEVLKDASAAAIYGSRAASGVVLVTTKSGRKNTPTKLDLNVYAGIQQLSKKLDVMNGPDWVNFMKANGDSEAIAGSRYANALKGNGTDWQDEMYRTAAIYKANLNISGGSQTSVYSASIGYLNQEGIMQNTGFDAFNARFRNEFSFVNDRLKIGESIIFKSSKQKGDGDDHSRIQDVLRMPAIVPVYDDTRPFGWGAAEDWMNNLGNPVGAMNTSVRTNRWTDVLFNAYAQAEILTGLKYKINFGLNQTHRNVKDWTDVYDFGKSGNNTLPDLAESNTRDKMWLLENTLTYDNTFGKHSISLLAGYSAQKNEVRSISASRKDLPIGTSTIDAGSVSTQSTAGSQYVNTLASYFGRVMYSFDSRYMFSASLRRDGSSKFSDGYRWGSFPSFSAGWNIHNESFAEGMKNVVDELKLRASYGKLGNQNALDPYQIEKSVRSGINYVQGDQLWQGSMPGINWSSPIDISWETTETYNIGVDATFLNGKLSMTADAFMQETKDLLMPVSMPGSSGLVGDPWLNAGVIKNKGIELAITHRNTVDKVFYSITGNLSSISNKVDKVTVGNTPEIVGYSAQGQGDVTFFKPGQPMGVFMGLRTDGLFQSVEEIKAYSKDGNLIQPSAEPGDIKFVDANGDGVIDNNDRVVLGKPLPDVSFGLRASAEWNGFDMSLFFDGMVGNSVFNFTRWRLESMKEKLNYSKDVLNAWTPSNTNTSMPRYAFDDPNKNARANSDRWIEKGDFVRLKTLEIGYALPKSLLGKIGLERLRVYTAIDNLFTITGYSGYTPDLGYSTNSASSGYQALSRGVDHGRYPQARSFSFGLQIGL